MRFILKHIQTNRLPSPHLDAQMQSLDFYRKLGFIAVGETFMDAGIAHQKMIWQPDDSFSYTADNISPEASSGESDTLDGLGDFTNALSQLLNNTRQSLHILSDRLPDTLFGNPTLTHEITRICKHAGRFTRYSNPDQTPQGLTRTAFGCNWLDAFRIPLTCAIYT